MAWCGLRSAHPGGMLTVCLDSHADSNRYAFCEVMVMTLEPTQARPPNMCPACERHLDVTHHGYASPMAVARTRTVDIRKPRTVTPDDVALEDVLSGVHRRPA